MIKLHMIFENILTQYNGVSSGGQDRNRREIRRICETNRLDFWQKIEQSWAHECENTVKYFTFILQNAAGVRRWGGRDHRSRILAVELLSLLGEILASIRPHDFMT